MKTYEALITSQGGTKANNYTESSTARSESTGDGNVTRRFLWDFVMQQGDVGEPVSIIQRWKLSVGKQAESPSATVVVDINPTGGCSQDPCFLNCIPTYQI